MEINGSCTVIFDDLIDRMMQHPDCPDCQKQMYPIGSFFFCLCGRKLDIEICNCGKQMAFINDRYWCKCGNSRFERG